MNRRRRGLRLGPSACQAHATAPLIWGHFAGAHKSRGMNWVGGHTKILQQPKNGNDVCMREETLSCSKHLRILIRRGSWGSEKHLPKEARTKPRSSQGVSAGCRDALAASGGMWGEVTPALSYKGYLVVVAVSCMTQL